MEFKKTIVNEKSGVRSILRSYLDGKMSLQFWQKNMKDKQLIRGEIIRMDNTTISIRLEDFNPFDKKFELYGHGGSYKFSLFKCTIAHIQNNVLTCTIPRSLICKDERECPRTRVDGNVEKYFSFYYYDEETDKKVMLRKRLIDVSASGLGFKNYKSDASNVEAGLKIFVEFDDDEEQRHKVAGEIVYKRMQSDEDTEYAEFYRVGVKFDEHINVDKFLSHLDLTL